MSHPYDRHVGRYGAALAEGLIGFAGVTADGTVLDVGCGTGQLTAKLAELAGPERITGIDPNDSVVRVARQRVPGADLRVGSATEMPFADGQFDASLAQLVVNLVDDPPAAVREMARVTKPGGVVAACFWDDEEMPLLRSLWDGIRSVAPAALAGLSEQAQVGLADVGILLDWWGSAGLAGVKLGQFSVSADYESFEDLWAPFEAGIGLSGQTYRALEEGERSAVRQFAFERLGSPGGPFRLAALVHAVRGEPGG